MTERWRHIKGYKGRYEVSDLGRVRSQMLKKTKTRDPERVMRQQTHWKGYKVIFFRTKGVKRKYFVHRLVAEAFLPNRKKLPIVNHRDGVRHNNVLSNLEWVSVWGNTVDMLRRARARASAPREDTSEEAKAHEDMVADALAKL